MGFKQKRESKVWQKAQIQKQVCIRSYQIITEDGREYRRNRQHLSKSAEPFINIPQTVSIPAQDLQPTPQHSAAETVLQRNDPPQQNTSQAHANNDRAVSSPPNPKTTTLRRSNRIRETPKYLEHYVTK